eukprot:TRINITY_DN3210_c0_g1_i2.p1 TRINITY_DN3210_c0_g1~~TRINITY_DN3210_c0_g1_i2.p1  ORF type:complete len:290 (-),score=34.07 TRINITY_DN3210_c0_g1_i2:218-1045(-)
MSTVELGSWNGPGTSAVLTLHGEGGGNIVAMMTSLMRLQLLTQLQSVVRSCTPTNQLPSDETMGRVRRGSLPATSAIEADLSFCVPSTLRWSDFSDDDSDIAEEREETLISWPDTGDELDFGEPQWQASLTLQSQDHPGSFGSSVLTKEPFAEGLYVPQADDADNDIAEEREEIGITWPDTGDEGDEGEPQWQARKASPQETPSGAFVASLLGLPNTKSAGHPETCRPCVFFWRRRCSQGEDCPFCHEEDHEQRFKAERAERNRRRPGLRIRRGL